MFQFTDTKEVAQTLCVELHLTGTMLQNPYTKGSLAGIQANPFTIMPRRLRLQGEMSQSSLGRRQKKIRQHCSKRVAVDK